MLFIQVEQHCVKRCTHHGQDLEAVKCFEHMQREGLSPYVISFICILKACGNIGALFKGKQMHNIILSSRLLKIDFMLRNNLVNMYSQRTIYACKGHQSWFWWKCGCGKLFDSYLHKMWSDNGCKNGLWWTYCPWYHFI